MTRVLVVEDERALLRALAMNLTARTGSSEKVAALDLGADDYVTKPFNVDELLARLRAGTRRVGTNESADSTQVGAFRVDFGAKTVTALDGSTQHLTPTEWGLLEALVRRPGKLVSGRSLLTELRGTREHTDASYLRIYIAQLRRKLEPEPGRPRHLITEPGMGYRFQP